MIEPTAIEQPPAPDPTRSLDWSALRDFLMVAECGSLSEAARRMGVSQPTLTRRMAALEASLQAELFRRSPRGLELTEAGEAMLEPARRMEASAHDLELAVSGRDLSLAGLVRITSTEGLAVEWLTPALASLRERQPQIDFEIIIRNEALNLLRREADIAVRLERPQQQELVARRIGDLALGLYASRAYAAASGLPRTLGELVEHRAVAFDEAETFSGPGSLLERTIRGARVAFRANTLGAQRAAIRAGYGIGGQARFIGDRDPELVRVIPELELSLEIWLVTHPGLRRSARIRAVYDFLAEQLTAARPLLECEG